jgi:hypothetical protein
MLVDHPCDKKCRKETRKEYSDNKQACLLWTQGAVYSILEESTMFSVLSSYIIRYTNTFLYNLFHLSTVENNLMTYNNKTFTVCLSGAWLSLTKTPLFSLRSLLLDWMHSASVLSLTVRLFSTSPTIARLIRILAQEQLAIAAEVSSCDRMEPV